MKCTITQESHKFAKAIVMSETEVAKSIRIPKNIIHNHIHKSHKVTSLDSSRLVHTYTVSGPYSIWTTYDPPCVIIG